MAHILCYMSTTADNIAGGGSGAAEHETIDGMLASALNMEDDISSGVYEDYMSRQHWPKPLDDDTFRQIKQRLTVLIEDTKKHKQILKALVREYAKEG
jgi:hypothetical protein